MSKKGGYQIIDLQGRNFLSGSSSTYKGIYDLIEGTNKRIILSGLVYGDIEHKDIECALTTFNNAYVLGNRYNDTDGWVIEVYSGDIIRVTIDDNDLVTITEV